MVRQHDSRQHHLTQLEARLLSAYRTQESVTLTADWRRGVMQEIERLAVNPGQTLQQMAETWFPMGFSLRFATATGLAALMSLMLSDAAGWLADLDAFHFLMNDPGGLFTLMLFGG